MVAHVTTRPVSVSATLGAAGTGSVTAHSGASAQLAGLASDLGFTPLELLDAALSGCLVLSVRIAARKRGWGDRLKRVDVVVSHEKATDGPSRVAAFTCSFDIEGEFSEAERAALIADAHEICTVGNTFEHGAIVRDAIAADNRGRLMAHIPQVAYAAASPAQQAVHDEELTLCGRMTNMKRTLLHSPVALRVYGEWFALRAELLPTIGDRAIFIFAHAISQASGSRIGTTFMRRALKQMGFDPDALVLSPEEADLARFGEAIANDPHAVDDALWAPLRARYSDKTLVDLVAFAGIMVATNVFTDVVDTPLDGELLAFLAPGEPQA